MGKFVVLELGKIYFSLPESAWILGLAEDPQPLQPGNGTNPSPSAAWFISRKPKPSKQISDYFRKCSLLQVSNLLSLRCKCGCLFLKFFWNKDRKKKKVDKEVVRRNLINPHDI